jgi:O-antigen/teichoic acid export membrane protein
MLTGSALRLGYFALAALFAMLLMPLMVHRLGDRAYGFWSFAMAFIGYYALIDLGLTSAISQYICIAIGRKDAAACRAVFNAALRIQSLLGCVALAVTAVLALAAHWIFRNPADASLFAQVIAILGINAALAFPARVYAGLLDAQLRFDLRSGLDLLALVLRNLLAAWVVLSGGGLLALSWTTLLASLPTLVLQVTLGRREACWARIGRQTSKGSAAPSLFSYSMYTFGASLADLLRFQVDALVISAFIGLAVVTHYRIATVLVNYYINALLAINGLFQPVMSRMHGASDRAGLERVLFFATKVSLCASAFICCAVIGWGRPFIARWMGVNYEDAYLPTVLLALAVFLDVSQGPSVCLLYATFRHRFYTCINIAEGVVNLVCSLLLVRSYGIVGVAAGTLMGAILMRVILQPIVVCRVSGLRYGHYVRFFSGNLLRFGAFMGLAILLLHPAIRSSYPWLAASALCATCLYAAGSWFLGFNRSERQHFRDALVARAHRRAEPEAAVVAS